MPRLSAVENIKINVVLFASTAFIGDNLVIRPRTRAVAVHQRYPVYLMDVPEFRATVFRRPKLKPVVREEVDMEIVNRVPVIKVDNVNIRSVSTSAVFQVGSTGIIDAEARVKHARRILD
ncbi:spore germination protein GerPE [Ferviditalea candida]|uniref:Spore germination protein GerPE n=1 Tax=Ferviditalea candida TaxID=3108399 RepID=A0ABU5ZF81_9BACL|nr:spore germination protein GerPE [Paenibacillaceae bacterium T2]